MWRHLDLIRIGGYGSIRVPLRGSFKGSIGGLGFRVDDINPALPQ